MVAATARLPLARIIRLATCSALSSGPAGETSSGLAILSKIPLQRTWRYTSDRSRSTFMPYFMFGRIKRVVSEKIIDLFEKETDVNEDDNKAKQQQHTFSL